MKKYFPVLVIIVLVIACSHPNNYHYYEDGDTIRMLSPERPKTISLGGGYIDSLFKALSKDFDTIGSIVKDAGYAVKTAYMPTLKRSIHLDDEAYTAAMLVFGGCDMTLFSNSGDFYDFVPVEELPQPCKELVRDHALAEGAKVYIRGTVLRLDRKDIVNLDEYSSVDNPLNITMPETVSRISGKQGEVFYFMSSIRDMDYAYIAFIFRRGGKYQIKAFQAELCDDDWIRANK
ncbi:hypothetical protein [Chitinophaga varians]|uniref:hypothetical protein n=1 Tax=Chitinophaga varians TaxID=2202339 RepID=UPI00165F860D|nr:hypothetical protein [Chitinophaga varians]MBC9914051.1 hypothetical protein [Chitinophaga varians]